MPCWEANVLSLDFNAADKKLLSEAAEMAGLGMIEDWWNGEKIIILRPKSEGEPSINDDRIIIWPEKNQVKVQKGYESHLQNLRQRYSLAAVKKAAKASGWEIAPKRNKNGEIEITVGKGA